MLSKIKIENFRCLREVTFDLSPLTFIVGPNGAGKSSVLLAIQLLKQSINQRINFNGEFVQLNTFKEVVYNGDESLWTTIGIYVRPSEEELQLIKPLISDLSSFNLDINLQINDVGYEVSFKSDNQVRQSIFLNEKRIFEVNFLKEGDVYRSAIKNPETLRNVNVMDASVILGREPFIFSLSGSIIPEVETFSKVLQIICKVIRDRIESTYYISTLRELVMEPSSDSYMPTWVGHRGQHTVGLLALIFGSREYEQIKTKICKWAGEFGLDELRAGWRGRRELSADYRDPKTNAVFKVTTAGHGSAQMLPIITQLFWSHKDSTICFEEPEMSLHLELISKLPSLFVEAVKEGKQLIVTTHEQNIFFALKPLIAKKELSHENVAIYELKKTDEGTTAQKLELTPEGTIKGGISSFVEAERNMIFQWMFTIPSTEGEKTSDVQER
jgi:predicted ATPase